MNTLATRLAFDYEIATQLRAPALGVVRAFASRDDLIKGIDVSAADARDGRARIYYVEYHVKTLSGPGTFINKVAVHYDLLANGSYPLTEPLATVVTRPVPWSPHFHPASGIICIGSIWKTRHGRMLFAQLAIHTARLLNYDEKKPPFGYTGWNGAAIAYWRDMLQYRPITPGLEYPELPIAITHGSSEIADDGFDSLHDESEFTPMTDESFVPLAPRV